MKRIYKTTPPEGRMQAEVEPDVTDVQFTVHKFSSRARPADRRRIYIVGCFSEFGCETVGIHYCLPRVMKGLGGNYVVAAGWHGRAYLYRHLVDEYWELGEEHQWLRNYTLAFHHRSRNLMSLETRLSQYGQVLKSNYAAIFCVLNQCKKCGFFWQSDDTFVCPRCKSEEVDKAMFNDIDRWKPTAVRVPLPCPEKMAAAKKWLGRKPVAVFASARKTYNRVLQPEFYVRLVGLLEDMGYTPVWLGEKVSTLACPVPHIKDFSRSPESRDLETTLAIISQCEFTVQYWTASTRLAGMMGKPYLLFDSPDQMWVHGHEGFRRKLCDFGPSKLVLNQLERVRDDHDAGIELTRRAIEEMRQGNYEDIFGLLEQDESVVRGWRDSGFHGTQINTYGEF